MSNLIAANPLFAYFGLCFLIAWCVWIPVGIFAPDRGVLVLPGAWAPTIAALLLTWFSSGGAGVRQLLGGLTKWRVGVGFYLFAIFGVLGIFLVASAVGAALGFPSPSLDSVASRFGLPPDRSSLLIAMAPLIYIVTIFSGGPIAEELGWRGYAQPRLQARIGAGAAGLVIGLLWSLWHLPLFHYFPIMVGGLPLAYYIPLVSALGVLFAWLYNMTGGSVLLCILLHAGVNFALGGVGAGHLNEDTRLLSLFLVLLAVVAGVLYLRLRSLRGPGQPPPADPGTGRAERSRQPSPAVKAPGGLRR